MSPESTSVTLCRGVCSSDPQVAAFGQESVLLASTTTGTGALARGRIVGPGGDATCTGTMVAGCERSGPDLPVASAAERAWECCDARSGCGIGPLRCQTCGVPLSPAQPCPPPSRRADWTGRRAQLRNFRWRGGMRRSSSRALGTSRALRNVQCQYSRLVCHPPPRDTSTLACVAARVLPSPAVSLAATPSHRAIPLQPPPYLGRRASLRAAATRDHSRRPVAPALPLSRALRSLATSQKLGLRVDRPSMAWQPSLFPAAPAPVPSIGSASASSSSLSTKWIMHFSSSPDVPGICYCQYWYL